MNREASRHRVRAWHDQERGPEGSGPAAYFLKRFYLFERGEREGTRKGEGPRERDKQTAR